MRKTIEKWQPAILRQFEQVVKEERLGHAYLFSGEVASLEMALWLAQSLFCQEKEEGLPCGQCRTCQLIAQEEFTDLILICPQGTVIKTDTIREVVKQFSQSGFESRRQVFVICDAEKMHPNAANSLLKVIEEPQSQSVVFLLTSQEEAILPTIKSRTQIVFFPKNKEALQAELEKAGVLKSEAVVLSELVATKEEGLGLLSNKNFRELLSRAPKFVESWRGQQKEAYFMIGSLLASVAEKSDQDRLLDLLTYLVSKDWASRRTLAMLESLAVVRQMWQSNVSLQNALEYTLLDEMRK